MEAALTGWIRTMATWYRLTLGPGTIALDGKEPRALRRMSEPQRLLVSTYTHQSGLTLTLRSCPADQETAAVQALLTELTLTGRVVTLDALHTQRETATLMLERGRRRSGHSTDTWCGARRRSHR